MSDTTTALFAGHDEQGANLLLANFLVVPGTEEQAALIEEFHKSSPAEILDWPSEKTLAYTAAQNILHDNATAHRYTFTRDLNAMAKVRAKMNQAEKSCFLCALLNSAPHRQNWQLNNWQWVEENPFAGCFDLKDVEWVASAPASIQAVAALFALGLEKGALPPTALDLRAKVPALTTLYIPLLDCGVLSGSDSRLSPDLCERIYRAALNHEKQLVPVEGFTREEVEMVLEEAEDLGLDKPVVSMAGAGVVTSG